MKNIIKKIIAVVLLIVVAVISMFPLAEKAKSEGNYAEITQSISEKEQKVLGVTLGATALSTALAAIPGDVTTPIAGHVLDLSQYLVIVLIVLELEELLLPLLGFVAFKYVIPAAIFLLIVSIIIKKEWLAEMGVKIAVFGLALAFIIPISIDISDTIYETRSETIEKTLASIESIDVNEGNKKILNGKFKITEIGEYISKIEDNIKNSTKNVTKKVSGYAENYIDAAVILLVTCAIIPVGVVFVLIGVMKLLFNINIPMNFVKVKKRKQKILESEE